MTTAKCYRCGEENFGAFVRCDSCGAMPKSRYDLAVSMLLSEHYFSNEKLQVYSERIKSGDKVEIPEEVIESILGVETSIKNDGAENEIEKYSFRDRNCMTNYRFSSLWNLLTQHYRNRQSAKIINLLREGQRPIFALYIRAFADDNEKFNKLCRIRICYLSRGKMPILCLSDSRSFLGVARINSTDKNWKNDFLLLARNAVVIFAQASFASWGEPDVDLHESYTWEIKQLLSDEFLGKSLLIQPYSITESVILTKESMDLMKEYDPENYKKYQDPESLKEQFMYDRIISQKNGWAEMLTLHLGKLELSKENIHHVINYYSTYKNIEPPQSIGKWTLFWQIMFDKDVRDEYSLPTSTL